MAASGDEISGERREPTRGSDRSKPDDAAAVGAGGAAAGLSAAAAAVAAEPASPGLHLVATPIGNLGDVSLRALAVLRGVDRIYCEDTRVTARLLARYGIATPLARYDDHNAPAMRPAILAALRRGERLALVSDAGTPLICDPGYKLVRAAIAENLPVTAAPGPSAALTALILSGLPPDAFLFAGFLPPRRAARRRALTRRRAIEATLIFFESAARLAETLADMAEILGSRSAAVARELTKLHEDIRRGALDDLARHYREAGPPRGEAVIVVGPPGPGNSTMVPKSTRGCAPHSANAGCATAAAKLAAETGLSRRELYRRALEIEAGKR